MANGKEGSDLQVNLDNISKELINIIAATGEGTNPLDDQWQADNHEPADTGNDKEADNEEFDEHELVRLLTVQFRSCVPNSHFQPHSVQFKRRRDSLNDDNVSNSSQETSESDIIGEIFFDYPLNLPPPDRRPHLNDIQSSASASDEQDLNVKFIKNYLPTSPLPSSYPNVGAEFIINHLPDVPLGTNPPDFANEINSNYSINPSLPPMQLNSAATYKNYCTPNNSLAARQVNFGRGYDFNNLPNTSRAVHNPDFVVDALKINDNIDLQQRKLYSNKQSYRSLSRNYQLLNTPLDIQNSSCLANNGMRLQEISHSNMSQFEPLNYKHIPSTPLAMDKPEVGAALPINSNSIAIADPFNHSCPSAMAAKHQNMPIFEMHYSPSKQQQLQPQLTVKSVAKTSEQIARAENRKNISNFNSPINQTTLLHSSLKEGYRNVISMDNTTENTSIDNNNNCYNNNNYGNGEATIDNNQFGWSSVCKEPNGVLRLFALLRDLYHAINEGRSKPRQFDEVMSYEATYSSPPIVGMPRTMSVQSQVKDASRLVHLFVNEMESILKSNRTFNEHLSIEYENFLNELRKLLEQFDKHKLEDLEHRFGQYTSEDSKVKAEQLEKILEKMKRQIRIVRTHFVAYNWFINVMYRKTADNLLNVIESKNVNQIKNGSDKPQQPDASEGILNDILKLAEKGQYQGVRLFKAQQIGIKSNIWGNNYSCNDDDNCDYNNYNYKCDYNYN